MANEEIVVIGCGDCCAGDDAVGIVVVEALRQNAPKGLSLRLMGDLGPGFLCELGHGASTVILVDAVKSGAKLGTVHFLQLPSVPFIAGNPHAVSTHSLGLELEIELALVYGGCPKMFLLGIEIGDRCVGKKLSPIVSVAVDKAIDKLVDFCAWAHSQPVSP